MVVPAGGGHLMGSPATMVPRATPRLWTRVGRLPEAGPARTGGRACGRSTAKYGPRTGDLPLEYQGSEFSVSVQVGATVHSSRPGTVPVHRRPVRWPPLVGWSWPPFRRHSLPERGGIPARSLVVRLGGCACATGGPGPRTRSWPVSSARYRLLGPEAHVAVVPGRTPRRPPTAAPAGGLHSCRWGSRPRIQQCPRSLRRIDAVLRREDP